MNATRILGVVLVLPAVLVFIWAVIADEELRIAVLYTIAIIALIFAAALGTVLIALGKW